MTQKRKKGRWSNRLPSDRRLKERLQDLRQHVENLGAGTSLHLVGDIYRKRELTRVYSTKVDSWIIGYRVFPIDLINGFFQRTIFIKLPKERIMEVSEDERNAIAGAIHQTMLDAGADAPEVEEIAYDCLAIHQRFSVMFWNEGNPNIIVPGGPSVKSPAAIKIDLNLKPDLKPDLKVISDKGGTS